MAMTAMEVRAMPIDDGDDLLPIRRKPARVPDLLAYQERLSDSATRHQRAGSKISTPTIRPNVVRRVDAGAEIRCMKLAVAQLSRNEWLAYIAMKEGVLFETEPGTGRRWWHVVPPPARAATAEQTARHYGLRVETVERYERRAREVLDRIRAAAGLTEAEPRVPIWPAIQTDEALLRHLFPPSGPR